MLKIVNLSKIISFANKTIETMIIIKITVFFLKEEALLKKINIIMKKLITVVKKKYGCKAIKIVENKNEM